jgi:hypothetical protein
MADTNPLDYPTPEPHRSAGPPPFWWPLLVSCNVAFVLTSWGLSSLFGVNTRDGGIWLLEGLGIVVTCAVVAFFKTVAPRGTRFPTWLGVVLGLVAPAIGLLIYTLFPWG